MSCCRSKPSQKHFNKFMKWCIECIIGVTAFHKKTHYKHMIDIQRDYRLSITEQDITCNDINKNIKKFASTINYYGKIINRYDYEFYNTGDSIRMIMKPGGEHGTIINVDGVLHMCGKSIICKEKHVVYLACDNFSDKVVNFLKWCKTNVDDVHNITNNELKTKVKRSVDIVKKYPHLVPYQNGIRYEETGNIKPIDILRNINIINSRINEPGKFTCVFEWRRDKYLKRYVTFRIDFYDKNSGIIIDGLTYKRNFMECFGTSYYERLYIEHFGNDSGDSSSSDDYSDTCISYDDSYSSDEYDSYSSSN